MSDVELLYLEKERRRRQILKEEGPKWDWYGPDCDCPADTRKEDGSCRLHPRAREKQRPPDGDWEVWMILAGRGFGKTKTGAQWIIHLAEKGPPGGRFALVGQQASDVRDIMIEGESGILSCSPPWFTAEYSPSKRRLTWPNGAMALCYSSEEPGQFRGPQFHAAWCDELAKWSNVEECWDNLQFGLRLGRNADWIPRTCVTTTPLPIPLIKSLKKDPKTAYVRGSMYENAANLARSFLERIKSRYGNTRLGRQEIEAEILEDTPGALWTGDVIDAHRIEDRSQVPDLVRVVVAVDPSVADPLARNRINDDNLSEAGIVGGGLDDQGHGYFIADRSHKGHPIEWGRAAVALYHELQADLMVAEVNNGGALVVSLIHSIDDTINVKMVHASRGKHIRAEPIASRYTQGHVHHVGLFSEAENELTTWVPGMKSPNRLDAIVWLFTELFEGGAPITMGPHPFPDYRG